jgi:hypothetical protein
MAIVNWLLELQLRTAVGQNFRVVKRDQELVFFKNLKSEGDDYALYCELLTESEVLEVGKILAEVYSRVSGNPHRGVVGAGLQNLNRNYETSRKFLRDILDLQGSSLHKLLLLMSGGRMLSDKISSVMTTLAKTKKDDTFPDDVTNSFLYSFLKKFYILPGVTLATSEYIELSTLSMATPVTIEFTSRLTAFFSKNLENLTLKDHMKLDFDKAIQAEKSLKDLSKINTARIILASEYRELAQSMTARELSALSQILINDASNGKFSMDILRSRSKAMEPDVRQISNHGIDSIQRYLSKKEQESVSSPAVIEHLDELISGRHMRAQNQPVVYASLAEVLSVKGERKALEVARTLEHLQTSRDRNLKMYEATVAIIIEALAPGNDDFPFGWSAQLSEHSWVLTSHLPEKELAEML